MASSSDDPYKVLGIPQNASKQEIRAAYRKLALRHHPDRQSSETEKREANEKFAAISHAYEILSDDASRQQYDHEQNAPYYPSHYEFHDPFQVFAHVFGQEFGGSNRSNSSSSFGGSFGSHQRQDPFFSDPFFGDSFFGGGRDPFFGGSMFGGSMFGGNDLMSQMNRQMDMMRQASQQQNGGGQSSSYYYSSSSSTFGGGNRTGESVTTTTRMINGKRQTVTERTVHKPDGTVERHTETTGDDDFPEQYRLNYDSAQDRPQLPSSSQHEEDHHDADTQPSPWKKIKRRITGHNKNDK